MQLGIDIIKIERIERALKNEHFKRRVFFDSEIEYAQKKHNSIQTYAGIYACKEAVIKALSRKIKNLTINKIEINHDESNAPYCKILDYNLQISISHEGEYAIAIAFLEGQIPPKININLTDIIREEDIIIPKREASSHKYNYSVVRVIGGCKEMIGAPLLTYESAKSALNYGAGLVKLCIPHSLKNIYQNRVKEETLLFIPDKKGKIKFNKRVLNEIIDKADCIVMGMGLGQNKNIKKIIAYLCQNFFNTLILDADALNAISNDLSVIKNKKCKLILTPHIGEFLRLNKDKGDLYNSALEFALKNDCVLVLKSEKTLITDGVKAFINVSGSPCMAKAGSGDVLAGIISAFSSFMTPIEACKTACYLFGKRGEEMENKKGESSVLASDLIL